MTKLVIEFLSVGCKMKFSHYDKGLMCLGLFFLAIALMACGTQGYIDPDKQLTEKNLYERLEKEGVIK